MDLNNFITVIIPTFNPHPDRLQRTLTGLLNQRLSQTLWELIIVDNNSTNGVCQRLDLTGFSNCRVVKESRQGLTFARLTGFLAAKGDLIVLVDDDNILADNYLQVVYSFFSQQPRLGAAGGRSLPQFEKKPPAWLQLFYDSLALRDLGDKVIVAEWENCYPRAAPIGAGMAIRKAALKTYMHKVQAGNSAITDRKGNSLSSGGDNDIVLEILKDGWLVAYFPGLLLQHIIPEGRTTPQYLARLVHDSSESWVKLLESHQINPWKKVSKRTLPLRKVKAWLTYRAWKNDVNFIRWKGACGIYNGLSQL